MYVSERAVEQRLARALRRDGEVLRRCRTDSRGYYELGRYYVLDGHTGCVTSKDIDIEAWAREAGVLKPDEVLCDVPAPRQYQPRRLASVPPL